VETQWRHSEDTVETVQTQWRHSGDTEETQRRHSEDTVDTIRGIRARLVVPVANFDEPPKKRDSELWCFVLSPETGSVIN
jgi:hypothetical protein